MPQAVKVVGQTEQQGLADLGSQAAPGAREESLRLTAENIVTTGRSSFVKQPLVGGTSLISR